MGDRGFATPISEPEPEPKLPAVQSTKAKVSQKDDSSKSKSDSNSNQEKDKSNDFIVENRELIFDTFKNVLSKYTNK